MKSLIHSWECFIVAVSFKLSRWVQKKPNVGLQIRITISNVVLMWTTIQIEIKLNKVILKTGWMLVSQLNLATSMTSLGHKFSAVPIGICL